MKTSDFNFRVPERLIPLTPPELRGERREDARMIVLIGGRDNGRARFLFL